jgi:hypothetical protein
LHRLRLSIAAAFLTACASGNSTTGQLLPSAEIDGSVSATTSGGIVRESRGAAAAVPEEGSAFVPPAGYRKRAFRGRIVYCKSETPVGTRFTSQYCFTEEQLKRIEANRQNVQREVDRARRGCVAAGSYCGGG